MFLSNAMVFLVFPQILFPAHQTLFLQAATEEHSQTQKATMLPYIKKSNEGVIPQNTVYC